jgi:deazaflavin-dependent oxidoreductase (nitroreductase family)
MDGKQLGQGMEKRQLDSQNQQIIDELRSNGGRIRPTFKVRAERMDLNSPDAEREDAERIAASLSYAVQCGVPFLVLHHFGARSGVERVNPVAYLKDARRYVVFGTHGGRPNNPLWFDNLMRHPRVTVEVEGECGLDVVEVTARLSEGAERDRLWKLQIEIFPPFIDYQSRTSRQIPVVVLDRTEGAAAPL